MNDPFEVGGKTYRVAQMDTFKQFHVARRCHPLTLAIVDEVENIEGLATMPPEEKDGRFALAYSMGIAQGFSKLSDADADFILNGCLDVIQRKDDTSGQWVQVRAKNGGLMFMDVDRRVMLDLVLHVVQDKDLDLLSFFGGVSAPSAVKTP